MNDMAALAQALRDNPDIIDAELAKRSLWEFLRQMWSAIDSSEFHDNWHIGAICEHLEAVNRGEIKRLLINIPPRHMKSIGTCVMWPAWTWIQDDPDMVWKGPSVRFLFSSYSDKLSIRDNVKCRRLMDSAKFQKRWGDRFSFTSDQNTKIRFENDRGGQRIATSVNGVITGEGGDIIVVDDPHNVTETSSDIIRQGVLEWWDEAMSTRLNDPKTGAFVIIMQRVHHQDMSGHLIEKGGWTHLCLPARYESDHPSLYRGDPRQADGEPLWQSRLPAAVLNDLEESMGSHTAAGQLQQRPSPREGGMFKMEHWEIVGAAPEGGHSVRGWDLAATEELGKKGNKAAWTTGVKMKVVDGVYYIENVVRDRLSPAGVERLVKNTAVMDGPAVTIDLPQDPGQAGKSQIRYMVKQLAGYKIKWGVESGSKETRAEAVASQQEIGNVRLVRGQWNQKFIEEAAVFPNSDFKDQVDAMSRAFHRLVARPRVSAENIVGPKIVEAVTGD